MIQAQNTLKALQLALDESIATFKTIPAEIIAGRRARADVVQFEANVAQQELSIQAQFDHDTTSKINFIGKFRARPNDCITVPEKVSLCDDNLPNLTQSIQLALRNDYNLSTTKIAIKN